MVVVIVTLLEHYGSVIGDGRGKGGGSEARGERWDRVMSKNVSVYLKCLLKKSELDYNIRFWNLLVEARSQNFINRNMRQILI